MSVIKYPNSACSHFCTHVALGAESANIAMSPDLCLAGHRSALTAFIHKVRSEIEHSRWKVPRHAQEKLKKHDWLWRCFQDLHQVEGYIADNMNSPLARIFDCKVHPTEIHTLFEVWDGQHLPGVHAEMRLIDYIKQHWRNPGFAPDGICQIGIGIWPCPMCQLILSTWQRHLGRNACRIQFEPRTHGQSTNWPLPSAFTNSARWPGVVGAQVWELLKPLTTQGLKGSSLSSTQEHISLFFYLIQILTDRQSALCMHKHCLGVTAHESDKLFPAAARAQVQESEIPEADLDTSLFALT